MRVAIITFHWATNYGAVLQAYALQNALVSLGADASIIDYYPLRFKKNLLNVFLTRNLSSIKSRLKDYKKDKMIERFRKSYLNRTSYYSQNQELKDAHFDYDCFLSGSDQIWNMSFTRNGEKKKTFSYFLDFVPVEKTIASYAASFGTTTLDADLKSDIKKCLQRYDFISLRECSAKTMLEDIGIMNSVVVPDPTLLLSKESYTGFVHTDFDNNDYAFVYMLHGRDDDAQKIISQAKSDGLDVKYAGGFGIEEWLSNIYHSNLVITNSFHGVVFSIIFNIPFIAILIEGSGMNDRITTLLGELGLENRIFDGDTKKIHSPIDWDKVNKKLGEYKQIGIDYLNDVLKF